MARSRAGTAPGRWHGPGRRAEPDGEDQGQLVQEIGVGLAQAKGDRACRVVGDYPGGQVTPLRDLVARLTAEDPS